MKEIYFLFILIVKLFYIKNNINGINNYYYSLNGVYRIGSFSNNNYYFKIKKKALILFNTYSYFRLIGDKVNGFYIESIYNKKRIGIDDYDKIFLYRNKEKKKVLKMIWNLIKVKNGYLIQNKNSLKYIEANNYDLICNEKNLYNKEGTIDQKFIFTFLKLYEEGELRSNIKIINEEPIDVLIKYIDLTDRSLNRIGISQIYKDEDNEELRYSLRSILNYIPWIRKIYILMPNDKIKFLKSIEEINNKIIYIKDKDFLGFDSANIHAFTFNLYKSENFGVSKNFIYMEDDFFIGKSLKKKDFFYYDKKDKKIYPYIITKYFYELNVSKVINEFNNLFENKDSFHPHSSKGWWLSIHCTNKYLIEHYNYTLINTLFTHNAIPENIDDLKEVYKEIQNYKYINETLFSKERYILTLNQPHFLNLYQLNIKHKKVHPISYQYIGIELINKKFLNTSLFVINTGGNHKPINRQYKIQKKIMEKRFPIKTIFEIGEKQNTNNKMKKIHIILFKIFIIIIFIKIYNNKKEL